MTEEQRVDDFINAGARVVDAALSGARRAGEAQEGPEDSGERSLLWHYHDEQTGYGWATPEAIVRARSSQIGLPDNLADCSFETWRELTRAHDDFGRWAAGWARNAMKARQGDKGHSLYLSGACGCGKSHLAVAALRVLVGMGLRARFYDVPLLMADLRAAWGDDVLYDYINPEVVCFDDLGASAGTELQNERLRIIISQRYAKRRITIITTNFHIGSREIEKLLGTRLLSRITGCYAIGDISLPDYRRGC